MRALVFAVCTLLWTSIACANEDCVKPKVTISTSSHRLPLEKFSKISKGMKVSEIFAILGPAARDVGSGLFLFEWDADDGRVFRVTTQGICETPMSFGLLEQAKS